MSSIHSNYKYSTPVINKFTKDMNLDSKDNRVNTSHNLNNNNSNKNIKFNTLPHSLVLNKTNQYQPSYNHITKLIQPDKLKNFYHFYEKENSKKFDNNFKEVFNNNIIELKDLIGKNSKKPIDINMLSEPNPKLNQGKISSKSFGVITSYAANTHQGIVRNYNEDRVSIIINMNKLTNYKSNIPWPKISYFAIFDGHAGNKCAEYLRENLLRLICSNKFFPENIPEAIRYGFEKAEDYFLNNYAMINGQLKDNSGTCGLILLIVNNDVYIGNVGDSRCIGSFNKGKIHRDITRDHKPNTPYEKERIMSNGGQIYQTKTNIKIEENFILRTKILLGPYRVFPGRLSVSRTIGDAEGKVPSIGGNPKVIICKPDIYKFNIVENDIDYFILGCDGIFDQMSSSDVFKCVSIMIERNKEIYKCKDNKNNNYNSLYGNSVDIHTTSGDIVDLILKAAMLRQSYDNVTCLFISFKNLLNTDFISINDNYNNNDNNIKEKNIREKYIAKNKESKNIVPSNSIGDYFKNNNNNKKNINIHEINKFMKKLKPSDSDSSIFKKKEELAISNESKEYSSKPLLNLYIKSYNKSDKHLPNNTNNNDNQSNHNLNLTLGNDKKYSEKKDKYQIIYKNNNMSTFVIFKENKDKLKYIKIKNNNNNSREEKVDSNSEEKKDKIFYNKKKIYFTGFKKNEPCDSKKREEQQKSEKKEFPINKKRSIKIPDSRNENLFQNTKSLKLNSYIYTNTKNNNYNKYINASETSYTLGNNKINSFLNKTRSSPSKKLNNNNKDTEKELLLNKEITNEIKANNLTDTKIKKNTIFDNIIRKKTYQLNLLKNFNGAVQNLEISLNFKKLNNNSNNIELNNNIDNTNKNNSMSLKVLKPNISQDSKNKYPSYKRAINLNDKEKEKTKDKNILTENNNINQRFFYFTKNNTESKYTNANNSTSILSKHKYNINENNEENIKKEKEPQNSDRKKNRTNNKYNKYNDNDNEVKRKFSHYLLKSNTENNFYN